MLWSCKSIDIAQPILNETDPIITGSNVVSQLSIPIEIGMQNQLNEVEKKLPMNFEGKDEPCEGVSFSYKFIFSVPCVNAINPAPNTWNSLK